MPIVGIPHASLYRVFSFFSMAIRSSINSSLTPVASITAFFVATISIFFIFFSESSVVYFIFFNPGLYVAKSFAAIPYFLAIFSIVSPFFTF